MKYNLFISTSQGIYTLNNENKSQVILTNKHTKGLFKKKGLGFFGICEYKKENKIIVASREKLKTKKYNKPATDVTLHVIDPITLESKLMATIYDLHDVHQIACDDKYVYLTDTGKNRVVCYNLKEDKVTMMLNIGPKRDDVHHLNALLIEDDFLMIGLNNRGEESQVLKISLNEVRKLTSFENDIYDINLIKNTSGVLHSHDIKRCGERLLCCSSHNGWVVDIDSSEVLIKEDMWVRGLASIDDILYVGASHFANRKDRHKKNNSGLVNKYNLKNFEKLDSFSIEDAGQINDMIIYQY